MIPQILHFCWVGNDPLNDVAVRCLQDAQRLHPGWEIMLWTKDKLPEMVNRDLYYASENTGHRADVLRIEVLVRYGGVYMDLDFAWERPVAEFGSFSAWVGRCGAGPASFQWLETAAMGSVPRHPFFTYVLWTMPSWVQRHRNDLPNVRTGPKMLEACMVQWDDQGHVPGVCLLPKETFYPWLPEQRKDPLWAGRRGTHATHLWGQSWFYQDKSLQV